MITKHTAGTFQGSGFFASTARAVLCIATVFLVSPSPAQAWEATVIGVVDGDTLTVIPRGVAHTEIRIRLYGVDAPEIHEPEGAKALAALKNLAPDGLAVNVLPYGQDRYGRTVAVVTHDETSLNYALIAGGHASVSRKYCKAKFCKEWAAVEKDVHEKRTIQP